MTIKYDNVEVSAFDQYSSSKLRGIANFSVEPLDSTFKLDVRKALVAEILTTENDKPPTQGDVEEHSFLEGTVHFEELDTDHIGMILSARHAWTWELGERLSDGPNRPIAVKTAFGWSLIGVNENREAQSDIAMNCCAVKRSAETTEEDLNRIFRYDFLAREGEKVSPEVAHPSRNDQHALKQFKETVEFDEEIGHYRCGLPWVKTREEAAKTLNRLNTAGNAANRLRKATERMHREPARKEGVWKQMRETIEAGHARKVENPEVPDGVPTYYLPLHIVPKKGGKWRCCHDAASRVCGICLNDVPLSGPDLVNRLVGVRLVDTHQFWKNLTMCLKGKVPPMKEFTCVTNYSKKKSKKKLTKLTTGKMKMSRM